MKKEIGQVLTVAILGASGILTGGDYVTSPRSIPDHSNNQSRELMLNLQRLLVSSEELPKYNPEERLPKIIDFMRLSENPNLNIAAQTYSDLMQEGLIDIEDTIGMHGPVDIVFFGGFPTLATSSYRIVVSKSSLTEGLYNDVDFSVYLYKSILMFRQVENIKGSAQEKLNIDRRKIEADVWLATIKNVAEPLYARLNDPYIKSLVESHQVLQDQGFINYWESLH